MVSNVITYNNMKLMLS